jgi:hypothetical protein
MIFRKNKPAQEPGKQSPAMRGRDDENSKRAANALARRFQDQDEPETIDLASPSGIPVAESQGEPDTRVTASVPESSRRTDQLRVISREPETGKFYVHAGTAETPVLLAGEPVTTPTELRRGDRIRIGEAEFEFLA